VMRSNLDLMLERLPIDLDTADTSAGVATTPIERPGTRRTPASVAMRRSR
jgi:hypothetical protein